MRVLIVEDDESSAEALGALLEPEGCAIEFARTLKDARQAAEAEHRDLILLDLVLPDGNGMDLVATLRDGGSEVVLITGHGDLDTAVSALRRGVADFLTKPMDVDRLRKMVRDIARRLSLVNSVHSLRSELRSFGRFGHLIGSSAAMQELFDLIEKVGPTRATVLLTGETGSGKERVAQTVHDLSHRAEGPMISLNCGAIAKELIASELFGHEKGAFTGANKLRKGCFQQAHGGTLFLDEIGEMPVEQQVNLLRVLETGRLTRLGSEEEIEVDVRVVAATNRVLKDEVMEGRFREDLMYRLSVFPLHVPPLRVRLEDVPLLCDHFLRDLESEVGKKSLSRGALRKLMRYDWPGNVRELRNVLHRAAILSGDVIEASAIPLDLEAAPILEPGSVQVAIGSSIAEAEKKLILATLESLDGDKGQAAKVLGISVKTLYTRLNQYQGG